MGKRIGQLSLAVLTIGLSGCFNSKPQHASSDEYKSTTEYPDTTVNDSDLEVEQPIEDLKEEKPASKPEDKDAVIVIIEEEMTTPTPEMLENYQYSFIIDKGDDFGFDTLGLEIMAKQLEIATFDGSGNNLANPEWGKTGEPLIRLGEADYEDGKSVPAGSDRNSPRKISNEIFAQSASIPNKKSASDYLWAWGQFLDHDIDLTEGGQPAEPFPIAIPRGDDFFDPDFLGNLELRFNRSAGIIDENGVRQQPNQISAYIDASNVYGSDKERAEALRTMDGTGKLKTSRGNLLPFNLTGLENAGGPRPDLFVAGDIRANETISLLTLHTLFVREHNLIAEKIHSASPYLSGEEIYQVARAIVRAEMQSITYNEFLPVLLGKSALEAYSGYQNTVNAQIANEFSTAAYRLGHTLLSNRILRLDANLQESDFGHVSLKDSFFSGNRIANEGGIAPILRGLRAGRAQALDCLLVDGLRNFLFGAPGAGGLDLASLNIQRGRDHGLPSYNEMRIALGMEPLASMAEISKNAEVYNKLSKAYDHIGQVDLWVGGLCEENVKGSLLGPTFHRIVADQFQKLRDGDRFFYKNLYGPEIISWIEKQTLSKIIRRNTSVGKEVKGNVFLAK